MPGPFHADGERKMTEGGSYVCDNEMAGHVSPLGDLRLHTRLLPVAR